MSAKRDLYSIVLTDAQIVKACQAYALRGQEFSNLIAHVDATELPERVIITISEKRQRKAKA
jgi:hypothetical protein